MLAAVSNFLACERCIHLLSQPADPIKGNIKKIGYDLQATGKPNGRIKQIVKTNKTAVSIAI